jgi:hypothetical protein
MESEHDSSIAFVFSAGHAELRLLRGWLTPCPHLLFVRAVVEYHGGNQSCIHQILVLPCLPLVLVLQLQQQQCTSPKNQVHTATFNHTTTESNKPQHNTTQRSYYSNLSKKTQQHIPASASVPGTWVP